MKRKLTVYFYWSLYMEHSVSQYTHTQLKGAAKEVFCILPTAFSNAWNVIWQKKRCEGQFYGPPAQVETEICGHQSGST